MSNVIDNVLAKSRYYARMDQFSRVKLADVAKRAGVSVATVSKVVNRRYGVAEATIARVQEAIDELGYAGNISASSLRSHRTNALGILVADFEPYSAELLKGVARGAQGTDYEILAYSGSQTEGWERRSLARLGGTLIDGAIMVTPTVVGVKTNIPVVAVDPHEGPTDLPTVDSDSLRGGRLATRHLIGLGHRRIALLSGRTDLDSARLREQGFRTEMAKAGIPVQEDLLIATAFQPDLATEAARRLLTMANPPTAIFAANDIAALRAMEVAGELGLRIPEDLSLVGFDDIPDAAAASPPLTTVRQPLQKMGEEALRLLLDLLTGVDSPRHVRLDVDLIERSSCSAPSSMRQRVGQ
jgi:LacI family transcriptional regulator